MNKVNTKVDMRLNVSLAGWISEDLKDALQRLVTPCTLFWSISTLSMRQAAAVMHHPHNLKGFGSTCCPAKALPRAAQASVVLCAR